MTLRRIIPLAAILLMLAGCAPAKPAAPEIPVAPATPAAGAAPVVNPTPAAIDPVNPPEPTTAPEAAAPAVQPQRGPGDFDLTDPTTGLGDLPRYQAELRLAFDGTKGGQPYHIEKGYQVLVDRGTGANLQLETGTREDGSSYKTFSGTVNYGRYGQPAPDQPCQFGEAKPQSIPFTPARMLPKLVGAESADRETVEGVAATVYTFDGRAVNAGDAGEAAGKVWIAEDGGWVVKYQLSLKSDKAFGEGITGEQSWEYTVTLDPGEAALKLPESCPLPLTEMEVPVPDNAVDFKSLPNEVRYATALGQAELADFYTTKLNEEGFLPQGDPVETPGGTRWLFGRRDGENAVLYVLTAKADGENQAVRLVKVVTQAPPAQAQ